VNGLSAQAVTIIQLWTPLISFEIIFLKYFLKNTFFANVCSNVTVWRDTKTKEYGRRAFIPHAEHDL
jgi:hypothetical protein